MKLLREFEFLADAESMSSRYRRKGILTHISAKDSYNLSRAATGAFKVGVWVVLPNQYEDAFKLLKNKNHKPEYQLSEAEIDKIEEESIKALNAGFNSALFYTALVALIAIIVALILYYVIMASG